MKRTVKVAGIQMSCKINKKEENVKKALTLIDQAAEEGAKIVLLQEWFNTDALSYHKSDTKTFDYAEPIPGPTINRVIEKAQEHRIYIISPIFEVVIPGVYYDSAPIIGPTGDIIGKYRKTHIPLNPKLEKYGHVSLEKNYWKSGSSLPVFQTEYGKIGILICYDRSFSEAWRILSLKGAEIIFNPNGLPILKHYPSDYWEVMCKARAGDHQVYAVFVNRIGMEENLEYPGNSLIVGPNQKILARAKNIGDEVILAELDLGEVVNDRRKRFYLRDLRLDLYCQEFNNLIKTM